MPESRSRRKPKSEAPQMPVVVGEEEAENPVWYKAVMFGFMVFGLLWILTFYISSARYPLGSATPIDLSNWNILIGFGIAMVGFVMTTRWK
ncbi:MAG: cell division protein CrgA [Aquiluna sp.]|nr:cell division protein CrgA [Aquiluna sp.]MCF8545662.1 cell division protein CrgA [Aquiluna sp.]